MRDPGGSLKADVVSTVPCKGGAPAHGSLLFEGAAEALPRLALAGKRFLDIATWGATRAAIEREAPAHAAAAVAAALGSGSGADKAGAGRH